MKRFVIGILAVMMVFGAVIPQSTVYADSIIKEMPKESNRADVIVTKYRVYNGVLQYRRWNDTRGYWVDPDWIDL